MIANQSSIQVSVVGSGIPKPRPSQAGRSIYRRQDQIVQQAVSVLFPKYTRRAHPDSPALTSTAGIQAMDLSPTANELYVVGGGDGELLVGTLPGAVSTQPNDRMDVDGAEIEQRAQRRMAQIAAEREAQKTLSLTGHVGDIRSARFFPSGEGEYFRSRYPELLISKISNEGDTRVCVLTSLFPCFIFFRLQLS